MKISRLASLIGILLLLAVLAFSSKGEAQTPTTLTIGSVIGTPGQEVAVSVTVHATDVRSVQVNLAFDGARIPVAHGKGGPALPAGWTFATNLAAPGDLRFIAFSPTGATAILSGSIFTAHLSIPPATIPGELPITVASQDIRDGDNVQLTMITTNGTLVIRTPEVVSNIATLMVTPAEVVSIRINPDLATIPVGRTQQFTAVCTLTDASTRDCTSGVVWVSSIPAVASIDAAGLATGRSVGQTSIHAEIVE